MSAESSRSPAAKAMDEAIDFAIEGRSSYPERAAFIDADAPSAGHDIERAAEEGLAVVLVSAEGSTRVLSPDLAADHALGTSALVEELDSGEPRIMPTERIRTVGERVVAEHPEALNILAEHDPDSKGAPR